LGHQYTVKDSASGTVTITSPTISVSGSGPEGHGELTLNYEAVVHTVDIGLGGTTFFGEQWHILIGQRLSAGLSSGAGTVQGHSWSVGGEQYQDYHFADWLGKVYDMDAGAASQPSYSCYFRKPGLISVSCSATLVFSDTGQSQGVNVMKKLDVAAPKVRHMTPARTDEVTIRDYGIRDGGAVLFCGSVAPNGDVTAGFEWRSEVWVDPPYQQGYDAGQHSYTQLISPQPRAASLGRRHDPDPRMVCPERLSSRRRAVLSKGSGVDVVRRPGRHRSHG
jgi:hypothetical protein